MMSFSPATGVPASPVTDYEIHVDFEVFVAVRTKDIGLGADLIYTRRGDASRYFDGSGTVTAAGVWSKIDGTTKTHVNTPKFSITATGEPVPGVTAPAFGVLFNTVLSGALWTPVGG
jgi:hypothetical protein